MTTSTPELLWPTFDTPADLAAVEAVPLATRGLPASIRPRRPAGLHPS